MTTPTMTITSSMMAQDGTPAIENYCKWVGIEPHATELRIPVFYHGTRTPELITGFQAGGTGDSILTGDAYGVGCYFTSDPTEASFHARDVGAVIPVLIRGELLDLNGRISDGQATRLSMLAAEHLQPSDKARFEIGRAERVFENVEWAREFFEAQQENWKHFGAGYARAEPEISQDGENFIIHYTDFDANVSIRNGAEAATLFKAIGWDYLRSAGFDGLIMKREGGAEWVVLHNTSGNIKSAIGNNGLYDGLCDDITDNSSYRLSVAFNRANSARIFLEENSLSKKLNPYHP